MALRLRNPRVRLHKYPFISIIYHNLTLHIIMSAANSQLKPCFFYKRKDVTVWATVDIALGTRLARM